MWKGLFVTHSLTFRNSTTNTDNQYKRMSLAVSRKNWSKIRDAGEMRGCSEVWDDLKKKKCGEKNHPHVAQAQLIWLLTWALVFKGCQSSAGPYIMCRHSHVFMETLFIALDALVSCCCAAESCLLMTSFMDYRKSSSREGGLLLTLIKCFVVFFQLMMLLMFWAFLFN